MAHQEISEKKTIFDYSALLKKISKSLRNYLPVRIQES